MCVTSGDAVISGSGCVHVGYNTVNGLPKGKSVEITVEHQGHRLDMELPLTTTLPHLIRLIHSSLGEPLPRDNYAAWVTIKCDGNSFLHGTDQDIMKDDSKATLQVLGASDGSVIVFSADGPTPVAPMMGRPFTSSNGISLAATAASEPENAWVALSVADVLAQ